MANIYDVNAAIDKPNVLQSFRQGQQYGEQLRQQQQARQDEQSLRRLAPDVIAGNQEAFGQAAAIDPQRAGQYDAANVAMAKRAAGAASYMLDAVKRGNPQEIQGRYQAVLPFLTKLGASQGKTPPPQFDPAMVPAMEQLVAMSQGMGQDANATPAGFQELHMKALAAGLQPGTPEYQQAMNIALGREGRAATGGFGFQKVVGADGRERMGRQNPRTGMFEIYDEQTGDFVPMGGGGALNGGQPMQRAPGEVPFSIDPSLPTQVQADIRANEPAWAQAQGMQIGGGRPGLGVGRSPEEQAALTTQAQEQAKAQAEIANFPTMTGLEAEREGAKAAAKTTAEKQAEAAVALPQTIATADETIALLDRALTHPGRATATGMSARLDPRNYVPGTEATNFAILLDQIKGKAFLQAFQSLRGGGAITEREGTAATNAIARLNTAQSDQEFETALRDLQNIVRVGRDRAIQRVSAPAATPQRSSSDIDALLDKYR